VEQNSSMEVSEHSDLQECNKAQISEMERFKWFMGEQIGHDPLRDRSINEIYEEWIGKYGAAFRAWWEEQKREKRKQYNGSACTLAGGDKTCNESNAVIKKNAPLFDRFGFFLKFVNIKWPFHFKTK